ncbi:pyruvate decarboxylase [Aspergillus japonicus CBS 114.51]|uniref:Pyruvate decarboxylase n=1 Tax=Aspergillus japonicus CBS 114.51 TaxID=1448312 RepID=A0A8T8X350_ASPJA|nr:pyruvate decarboxylase [Aspergillus japonicus CBS 114.51]RAH82461.1 pyruvate decarboxylase [Aspergillus japonicus CBS 114.51]
MSSVTLAEYLFTRLVQLGVHSLHGVPGDFNLRLLDYVEPTGLRWVGNANELNAGYAADGYARIKGVGALITTFGVGELSAINAIAGAFAERAAVVHIVGTPSRETQDQRQLVHHTFNDGEYRRFSQMASHVTVAQTRLWDLEPSPAQIDEVLQQCLRQSRPVYIEIPVDMVDQPVPVERLSRPLDISPLPPVSCSKVVLARILDRVYVAKRPVIVVDGESRPMGILGQLQRLITSTQWPFWTTAYGKGLLDETTSNCHGVYRGIFDSPEVQAYVNGADLVLYFGPHLSSTNTFSCSAIPRDEVAIYISDTAVQIGPELFRDVSAQHLLSQILKGLDVKRVVSDNAHQRIPRLSSLTLSEVAGPSPITQNHLWRLLAGYLRPGDIVLGETGTAGYGVREMALPRHSRVFTPVTWLSIGYMLPASQGAALAQRELMMADEYQGIRDARTILFIGDGSFQMTAQELGTIIRLGLNVVVFVVNNDGYTIERCIHGRQQAYNDITRWRYLQAPQLFGGGEEVFTASARTWDELGGILTTDQLWNGSGLRMVEIVCDREDAPSGPLVEYLQRQNSV